MTPKQVMEREIEKTARKIGVLVSKTSPEVLRGAIARVVNESQQAARIAEDLAFLTETAEPTTGDF